MNTITKLALTSILLITSSVVFADVSYPIQLINRAVEMKNNEYKAVNLVLGYNGVKHAQFTQSPTPTIYGAGAGSAAIKLDTPGIFSQNWGYLAFNYSAVDAHGNVLGTCQINITNDPDDSAFIMQDTGALRCYSDSSALPASGQPIIIRYYLAYGTKNK